MSKHAWQNFQVPELNQKLCFSVGIGVRHLLFTTILPVDVFSLAVKGRWEFVTLSSFVSLCDIWVTTSGELRFRCELSLRIQGDLTGNKGSENFLCIFAMMFAEGKWEWQCERHIPETRERTRKGALEVTCSFPWLSEPFVSKRASKLNPSSPKTFPALSTFDFSLWVSLDCPLCPGNSRVKNSWILFLVSSVLLTSRLTRRTLGAFTSSFSSLLDWKLFVSALLWILKPSLFAFNKPYLRS